jgi:putative membrane protein
MIKRILNLSDSFENKEDIILRDYLALERTKLANERTLLSYIRTSLYLLLAGIAILQLQGFDNIKWIGLLSLGLSVLLAATGIIRFYHLRTGLKKYYRSIEITNTQK